MNLLLSYLAATLTVGTTFETTAALSGNRAAAGITRTVSVRPLDG